MSDSRPNRVLGPPLLIDSHVHFHSGYELELFLNAAARNFATASEELGSEPLPSVLMLTESFGKRFFETLRGKLGTSAGGWSFHETDEKEAIVASREGSPPLVFVAGRQIVTAENLEVLALGCLPEVPDKMSMAETLAAVRRVGALPAVPWGFGKWWLTRGRLVAKLIASEDASDFFLGDNGGRWLFGPRPRLFRKAELRGIRVLPGTDPLPLRGEAGRVGSFGLMLEGSVKLERPVAGVKVLLRASDSRLKRYGEGTALTVFLRNQVGMQLRKRLGRTPERVDDDGVES